MHVAIDTSALYTTQAGVARYIRGLLRGLRHVPHPNFTWSEVVWPVANFDYRQPARWARTFYRELIWGTWVAPGLIRRAGASVLHSTASHFIRVPAGVHTVVTLHDVAVLRHPERFRRWHRESERRRLRRLPAVDRVVCVSRFSADEAIGLLGLQPRRVEVVHNGCDFADPQAVPAEQRPEGLDLTGEFFLFVGSLEPGKNLALLRRVYAAARAAGKPLPPLVIVGARWLGVAGEGPPPADWHYLGRQPDGVLIHLYRRALALVFPSLYEGFGLPLLEAMALGCPVICSRVASLPEVAGDAALYAVQDETSYAAAMRRLAGDAALREDLIAAGRRRVQEFTWDRCAQRTAEIYAAAAAERA